MIGIGISEWVIAVVVGAGVLIFIARSRMPKIGERDQVSENPYQSPNDAGTERKSGSLPWWLRPGTPSVLTALPIVGLIIFLIVAFVMGILWPIIQQLSP